MQVHELKSAGFIDARTEKQNYRLLRKFYHDPETNNLKYTIEVFLFPTHKETKTIIKTKDGTVNLTFHLPNLNTIEALAESVFRLCGEVYYEEN